MIKNKNMTKDAKMRVIRIPEIDKSSETTHYVVCDNERDLYISDVVTICSEDFATSTATIVLGTATTSDYFASDTLAVTLDAGDTSEATVSVRQVPKGTPIIAYNNTSDGAGKYVTCIHYWAYDDEPLDGGVRL